MSPIAQTNLLFIMSDEHQARALGCAGHDIVRTPNIDKLAGRGTRFSNAYSNSPMCVPSRASFATGQYVHQTGYWTNAHPYEGRVGSWGHALQGAGHGCVSIGKLHYRFETDPCGFDHMIIPLNVVGGIGAPRHAIKDPIAPPLSKSVFASKVGAGDSSYQTYDQDITERTCEWLKQKAAQPSSQPWMLFSSFVCPHFPLIARQEFLDLYEVDAMPLPKDHGERKTYHPWVQAMRDATNDDSHFTDATRRLGIACYYALCSYLDANVGRILDTLDETGLSASTRVIYASDHGESLGARGMWGKSNMFEESVGIPMIVAGPDVPAGKVSNTPVSLVDGYATILQAAGVGDGEPDATHPGRSLFTLASASDQIDRVAFSEYHGMGAVTGGFMIRKGRWKYNFYAGFDHPELYDLENDPEEMHDLGSDPAYAGVRAELHGELLAICDPAEVEARSKADQHAVVESQGGRDAVLAKGAFQGSPVPGEAPKIMR